MTAAYGLVNANEKWQVQSDQVFFQLRLRQCQQVSQLLYLRKFNQLVLVVAKIVYDIKVAGAENTVKKLTAAFHDRFELGSINSGTGNMRFHRIDTFRDADMTITTGAKGKLGALTK